MENEMKEVLAFWADRYEEMAKVFARDGYCDGNENNIAMHDACMDVASFCDCLAKGRVITNAI